MWNSFFNSSYVEQVIYGVSLINVNKSIILSKIKLVSRLMPNSTLYYFKKNNFNRNNFYY